MISPATFEKAGLEALTSLERAVKMASLDEINAKLRARRIAVVEKQDEAQRKAAEFQAAVQEVVPGAMVLEMAIELVPSGSPRPRRARLRILAGNRVLRWTGFGNTPHEARMNAVHNNTPREELPF